MTHQVQVQGRLTAWRCALLLALALVPLLTLPGSADAQQQRWGRNYFPNVILRDHNGRSVRFYDDVIRGRVVSVNFIYTACTDVCPLDTAQLRRVQQILGARVGRDVHMYTISVNPARDQPEDLRRFMRTYDVGPGWTFLTGSPADVQLLQQRFGLRPVNERTLRDHDTSIMVGNERSGRWMRRTAYESPELIADLLGRVLQNYGPPVLGSRQSYELAGEVTDRSRGYYIYRTRCRSCHTVGEGDRLGPDLLGVAAARSPAWLRRWIREPDVMIAERDPQVVALMARYRNLPMPNLGLTEAETEEVIAYLRRQDEAAARTPQRASTGR